MSLTPRRRGGAGAARCVARGRPRPLPPERLLTSALHSSLSDFSEDMFLIKDGMNTCKKQKHKQRIPQGHSGCDLKNKKQNRTFAGKEKRRRGGTEGLLSPKRGERREQSPEPGHLSSEASVCGYTDRCETCPAAHAGLG